MASSLSITVGGASATLPINATNAQVSAALTRYARSLAIPVTGVAQDDLTAILAHFVDDVRRRSKQVEIADTLAAAQVTAQATADADNSF